MATEDPQDVNLNLPLVSVRGITDADLWQLYERYHLPFTPPTPTERDLARVIVALEELVGDQEATIQRLRKRE